MDADMPTDDIDLVNSPMGHDKLPNDLVIEILQRLPVKSLIRFKCVSKPWNSFIKSPSFVKNHFLQKNKNGRMLLMRRCLLPSPNPDNIIRYYDVDVLSFHDLNSLEQAGPNLSIPFFCRKNMDVLERWCQPTYSPESVRILGPCNGIICIIDDNRVILCNPALREFKHLPLCPSEITRRSVYQANAGSEILISTQVVGVGFGIDSSTNDLKILFLRKGAVRIGSKYPYEEIPFMVVLLYNTSTNDWKMIDYNNDIMCPNRSICGVFLHGTCHWNAGAVNEPRDVSQRKILCFDINHEIFKQLDYPANCVIYNDVCSCLTILNECLAIIRCRKGKSEIWVMTEYGISSSWRKQFFITTSASLSEYLPWRDDRLLQDERRTDQLSYVELHTDQVTKLQIYGKSSTFQTLIYEESLLSLK